MTWWWSFRFSWSSKPLAQPWRSIALALVGVLCSAGALFSYLQTRAFMDSAIETTGTVVELVRRGDAYAPVIAFYDEELHRRTFRSATVSSSPRYTITDPVTVLYSSNDPGAARIKNFWSLWLPTVVTGTLGLSFSFASVLLRIYRRPSYRLSRTPDLSSPDTSRRKDKN